MKEICKNCGRCRPTYKGGICEKTGKKTKLTGTCEDWRPKTKLTGTCEDWRPKR